MAVVLSLITSALWGTSDFFGGLASRREPVSRIMLWAHSLGLVTIAIIAPLLAETIDGGDLVLGAAAGVVGLVGLLLLYSGLSHGPMAVVAPLSALTAALVPVLWGLRSDDPLSGATTIGLVIGLVAVVAISWEGNLASGGPPVTAQTIGSAVIAGMCFGSIVLIYDATSGTSAPWPIVSGRVVTVVLLLLFAVFGPSRRTRNRVPLDRFSHGSRRSVVGFAAIAGLGDTFANVTLLLATNEAVGSGELSVVAVVTALFPAATVVWARLMLDEPLGRVRIGGLILALAAVSMMTIG